MPVCLTNSKITIFLHAHFHEGCQSFWRFLYSTLAVRVRAVIILGYSLVRKQLFEVLGQQFLLQGQTNPSSCSPYIGLDLPHALDMPVWKRRRDVKFVFLMVYVTIFWPTQDCGAECDLHCLIYTSIRSGISHKRHERK